MHDQRGFSIIELIVVIAIMGILTGIAIPVYFSLQPKFRLNGAARQIMGDLMWARMQSVSQNNEFKVFFLQNNCIITEHKGFGSVDHIYQILDDDDGDGNIDVGESVIEKHIQTNYYDVIVKSKTADPVFLPRGNAFGASIELENLSGTKSIAINVAGRVRIN